MKKSVFLLLLVGILSLAVCYGDNTADNDIFFIHLADIHLCNDSEVKEVFGGTVPPVTTTKKAVNEVINFKPEVVVQTGDIVALADKYDLDTCERWYNLVNETIYVPINKTEAIPFLFAPGNHDPAGIKLKDVDKSDPRYGNGLLLKYLLSDKGKTYYSFDYGKYHFVIIDPEEIKETGYRAVRLPEEQLEWLKEDLKNNSNKYIIICYHQPLGCWVEESRQKFLDVVEKYKGHILLIAGHTHDNRVMDIDGIPEHQGGAVCGDWWQTGKTPDGYPLGYVIYYINDSGVFRFYKAIEKDKQINLLSPRDAVLNSGFIPIEVNVYYKDKTIERITYKIDDGDAKELNDISLINISDNNRKIWWYNAKGYLTINPDMVDNKKHTITIEVISKDGETFSEKFYYKFSNNPIMNISEIIENFNDYYGLFATINGTIKMVAADGNLLAIKDKTGKSILVWAGDCKHDNFSIGDKVILRGVITEYKGTKELKLVKGSDAQIYGHEEVSPIDLPNIETAYKNFTNLEYEYVKTKGVVTAVFGDLVFIQDDTRGIAVWLGEIEHEPIEIGDVVSIAGILMKHKNMIEIAAIKEEDLKIEGSAPVPAPKEITIDEIKDNLGNLVVLKDLTVESVDDKKITVRDNNDKRTTIYCAKAGFDPTKIVEVGDKIDVIGIAYRYKDTYEILPRSENDILDKVITLEKGWNSLSIPHKAHISFSNPENVGTIMTYYKMNWHKVNKLEPLYGYYIYCNNDTYMYIRFIKPGKNEPNVPLQRFVYRGWNLVGVNPGTEDIEGVKLGDFVVSVEDVWIMIIDPESGRVYNKYNIDMNVVLEPYKVYWMFCKEDGLLAGRCTY